MAPRRSKFNAAYHNYPAPARCNLRDVVSWPHDSDNMVKVGPCRPARLGQGCHMLVES